MPESTKDLEALLRLAAAALHSPGAFLVRLDSATTGLVASTPGCGDVTSELVPALGPALAEGRLVTVPLAANHSRFRDLALVREANREDGRGVGALVCAPIQGATEGSLVGLCVWDTAPRAWAPVDLALLDDAARALGHHLHSAPAAPRRGDFGRTEEGTRDWFDIALDSFPAGVLIARAPEGDAIRVNAEYLRIIEASAIERMDNLLGPLFTAGGSLLDESRHPLRRALAGELVRGEVVCSSKDSDEEGTRWWRINASPLGPGGEDITGAVLIVEDITEVRGMQESLYRSQEHLVHAHKMEAVGRLAGGMAHDFNNLLTAIMGFGELLLEGLAEGDPAREDAEEIVRSAGRGRDLTNQLLSFSRTRTAHPDVLALNEGLASSRRLLERLLEGGVRLETDAHERAGGVRIDRTELEQILVNLALNGRDALGPDGGTIRIATGPVDLTRPREAEPEAIPVGRWETLTVQDDGTGMDPDVRRRIFEPFFTTKAPGRGTGLGLATVYGIVKRLGGFIQVDSRPLDGTTFCLYLPSADPTDTVPDAPAEPEPIGSGETVLLVEDQDQIRSLLARQLERSGFEVIEAANGYEALTTWQGASDTIDIIVSDIVMPVMDGPSMVERVRAQRSDLPVVFISGYPGAADPSERETPLPDAPLLRKPFAAAELVKAIRGALDGS